MARDVHDYSIPHPHAADAVAPHTTTNAAAASNAVSGWYVGAILRYVDALGAVVRYALLQPVPENDDHERSDVLRHFTRSLEQLAAYLASHPIAPNLTTDAAIVVVKKVRRCVDWAAIAVTCCYLSAAPSTASAIAFRLAAELYGAQAGNLWLTAVRDTPFPCGVLVPVEALVDAVGANPGAEMLRADRLEWRCRVLQDLFDPDGLGGASLMHYALVVDVLNSAAGEEGHCGIHGAALDALCDVAATGALRLFATEAEARAILRGKPSGHYLVAVGSADDSPPSGSLYLVEGCDERRAAKARAPAEAHKHVFPTVVALHEHLNVNPFTRTACGADYKADIM
jgi:hypothetical protein